MPSVQNCSLYGEWWFIFELATEWFSAIPSHSSLHFLFLNNLIFLLCKSDFSLAQGQGKLTRLCQTPLLSAFCSCRFFQLEYIDSWSVNKVPIYLTEPPNATIKLLNNIIYLFFFIPTQKKIICLNFLTLNDLYLRKKDIAPNVWIPNRC